MRNSVTIALTLCSLAAWLHFLAHRYRRAQALYERARKLIPAAREPVLGLAWTLYRQKRPWP